MFTHSLFSDKLIWNNFEESKDKLNQIEDASPTRLQSTTFTEHHCYNSGPINHAHLPGLLLHQRQLALHFRCYTNETNRR